MMKFRFPAFLIALSALAADVRSETFTPTSKSPGDLREAYDVIIAGAGTGGTGAAIQAARMGASVLLLEETEWIGGQMNAAAVTSMDEASDLVRQRGVYREFLGRVFGHYEPLGIHPETAYNFRRPCMEPRVGRRILHDMLDEARGDGVLDLVLRATVRGVKKEGDTVTGVEIAFAGGEKKASRAIRCKILVDATEWGDVIPLTGARYRVGNCISDDIDRTRQVQSNTWTAVVKQYPRGVPEGFLLPGPPPGYTDAVHAMFLRTLENGDDFGARDRPWTWKRFICYRGMPNSDQPRKPDEITRTHLNFNNDFTSSVAEIEDPVRRQETDRAMRLRTLQLVYYIQNSLGKTDWAVADDEGYDTPYNRAEIDAWIAGQPELEPYREVLYHFSIIPYVRESRRIIGRHTLKAREIDRAHGKTPVQFPDGVAIGDYPVDMHGSMKAPLLELELDRPEDIPGDFGGKGSGPFSIPFDCFIPEKIDGFLPAEKNLSQSRMGNGATRLQPSTMLMGQAAGAIAALSVTHGVQPRELDPVLAQNALLDARDILNITPLKDIPPSSHDWKAIQLVTTHGMMPLREGKFDPQSPVTPEDLAGVLKVLGKDGAAPESSGEVTRAEFAAALAGVAEIAGVKLAFESKAEDRAKPVTRSEAAQVLAEFLTLRAQAKMTSQPQTLSWTEVRPASEASKIDVTSTIVSALELLERRGIISSTEYWINHAVEGVSCDGELVGTLMLRAARFFDPEATRASAPAVFCEHRILGQPKYWEENAVNGKTCSGKNVSVILRALARTPEIKNPR